MLTKIKLWLAVPFWKRYPYIVSMRPSILLLYIVGFAIIFTLIVTANMTWLHRVGADMFPKASFPYLEESLKVIGGTFVGGLLAVMITNSWQQKSIGLEMLKELNSPEFMAVRNALSTQMRVSRTRKIELDNLHTWFPCNHPESPDMPIKVETNETFIRNHALASMVYFVVRMSNYARNGMLNVYMTQHLFAVFFVHYREVVLEFAEAMEMYLENYYLTDKSSDHPEVKSRMWVRRIEDLRYFFEILSLSSSLDTGNIKYEYKYFFSLIKREVPGQESPCVAEMNLGEIKSQN